MPTETATEKAARIVAAAKKQKEGKRRYDFPLDTSLRGQMRRFDDAIVADKENGSPPNLEWILTGQRGMNEPRRTLKYVGPRPSSAKTAG